MLHATDAAKARAVSVLEDLGGLVLDEPSVPDADLRTRIYARHPREEISLLVEGCRGLREGDPGSHLGFVGRWHAATRQYSPALLEAAPLCFPPGSELGLAVEHLRQVNRNGRRKLGADAPLGFLPPRWRRHVLGPAASADGERAISRPHYEAALLSTLNERIKSGDVTVEGSRRWADFDNYLIAQPAWAAERLGHYAILGLPTDPAEFVAGLDRELKAVTEAVEARLASSRLRKNGSQGQRLRNDGRKRVRQCGGAKCSVVFRVCGDSILRRPRTAAVFPQPARGCVTMGERSSRRVVADRAVAQSHRFRRFRCRWGRRDVGRDAVPRKADIGRKAGNHVVDDGHGLRSREDEPCWGRIDVGRLDAHVACVGAIQAT